MRIGLLGRGGWRGFFWRNGGWGFGSGWCPQEVMQPSVDALHKDTIILNLKFGPYDTDDFTSLWLCFSGAGTPMDFRL